MFLKDIQGNIVQVGDTLAYATDGHGSTPNLGLARVDLIKWFSDGLPFQAGMHTPRVRCHIIKHSNACPGQTVWLTRVDRMVKVNA